MYVVCGSNKSGLLCKYLGFFDGTNLSPSGTSLAFADDTTYLIPLSFPATKSCKVFLIGSVKRCWHDVLIQLKMNLIGHTNNIKNMKSTINTNNIMA